MVGFGFFRAGWVYRVGRAMIRSMRDNCRKKKKAHLAERVWPQRWVGVRPCQGRAGATSPPSELATSLNQGGAWRWRPLSMQPRQGRVGATMANGGHTTLSG
jgi:hypothetical protein